MDKHGFEQLLSRVVRDLDSSLASGGPFRDSASFEAAVRRSLEMQGKAEGVVIDFNPHPHAFPDIVIGKFGIEVKFTDKDTWRSVANSVFESRRDAVVEIVYLLFGKMGGAPEVKWADYATSVVHVRTSHVPRFEVELDSKRDSLFKFFGITYDLFQRLEPEGKMEHIRRYARSRLEKGERLWWLESGKDEDDHSLPIQARLYTSLNTPEKRQYRAEAALLCPSVVKSSRSRNKYDDAALYLLTYRGVLCTQVRDLFSAGSVAMRAGAARGGNYIERALRDIQAEMKRAARELEGALFVEYWGASVPPEARLREWLRRADAEAGAAWRPSETLFTAA